MRIILGSTSPWRAQVMRTIVPDFEVMDPGVDEKSIRDPNPQTLVMKLARAKSEALRPRITGDALLITADQVIVFQGEIREKPRDADQARRWLRSYRGEPIRAVNGLMSYNSATKRDCAFITETCVWLKNLTDHGIDHLVADPLTMRCSGACAAGHPEWDPFVSFIDGDADGLYGLPREVTRTIIATECS